MRHTQSPIRITRGTAFSVFVFLCFGLWAPSSQSVHAGTAVSPTGGTGSPACLGTIVTSGTSATPTNLCTANCVITGGTKSGNNLFHSLGELNLASFDNARFQTGLANPIPDATVSNILARITDPQPSSIFGTVDSASFYPSANLYLLNPNGIVFGPNASLNVAGSVTFTTANYLRLAEADGSNAGIFHASPAIPSVFTSAPVSAFGFLGSNPAAIRVEGSTLSVQAGQSISLVGGNQGFTYVNPDTETTVSVPAGVTVGGGGLFASSGQVNMVSVASAGEVLAAEFLPANGLAMGNISLSQGATLDVSGDPGGTVRIRGGQFEMDQAYIFAGSSGDIDGATTAVSVHATEDMLVKNQSTVDVTGFGAGRTGNIEIEARSLMLTDGSIIANQGFGNAPAGNISLTIEQSLTMEGIDPFGNGSLLQTINAGSGTGGTIALTPLNTQTSPTVTIADGGKVLTQAGGQSAAGDITMNVTNLIIATGGSIQTLGGDTASSGNIHLIATGEVSLMGQGDFATRVLNQNSGPGGTGWIKIEPGILSLTNKAQILSETTSIPGNLPPTDPKVLIAATDSVTIAGGSRVDLSNNASSVGSLDISATNTIAVSDLGLINTSTIGQGNAGAINLTARNVSMTSGGQINSLTQGTAATGTGGDISIVATESISLSGRGTNSLGTVTPTAVQSGSLFNSRGKGGDINITAGQDIRLTNTASVSASSTGTGNAGNITALAGDDFMMQNSSITTQATQASGGNIKIGAADQIVIRNSLISASVMGGSGSGGNISIDPNVVVLQNSQILAQAIQGNGGNITIFTPLFLADSSSLVSASSQFGLNGTVTIQSPTSNLSGGLGTLTSKPRQAQSLLTQRCAALANGQASSFVVAGREQLPADPGGWLASPLAFASLDESLVAGHAVGSIPTITAIPTHDDGTVSLRRFTPAGFLMANYADSEATGCHS